MSSGAFAGFAVGNDFIAHQPRLKPKIKSPTFKPEPKLEVSIIEIPTYVPQYIARPISYVKPHNLLKVGLFFILGLLISGAISAFVSIGWYSHIFAKYIPTDTKPLIASHNKIVPNLNIGVSIPISQLSSKLHKIETEPISLKIGGNIIQISNSVINSWINISTSKNKLVDYLNVNSFTVKNSILSLANQNVQAPVDSITISEAGVITTILPGSDGTKLANPTMLSNQALKAADNILNGKGFQLNAPLANAPFQTGSLTNMGKALDVNLITKRMYAYDNGQLVNSFLVSAGAPATPTPTGEFQIWEKLPVQTMSGYNPDGSTYVQPNVQWVNYFDHSGDAVHGNYWRPASYFGNINSSHGCVGLQVAQAEWVYNWAPIGTTVITHT